MWLVFGISLGKEEIIIHPIHFPNVEWGSGSTTMGFYYLFGKSILSALLSQLCGIYSTIIPTLESKYCVIVLLAYISLFRECPKHFSRSSENCPKYTRSSNLGCISSLGCISPVQMIKRNGNSSEEIRELKIVVINQFCMASTLSGPHIMVHM